MKRSCGLYARVSTERQSEIKDGSLDTQISRLKNYISFRSPSASKESWKVTKIYREEGKSGKNIDRPELQNLLSDIKTGKINAVLCTKIDRISRSLIDFYKLVELFEKHHIEFISLEENFDTSTPMGKAMLKITLVFAELEREQTSKRTKDKMQWRAEQGLWNGGQVLGYDIVDKKLVVNKKEAKLVKLMFEKYLELGSVLKVVEWLNKHGYRTKEYISNRKGVKRGGKIFFNANVLQKLRSRLYLGEIEHNAKTYKGRHEAIIDKSLWNDANKFLELHAPTRKNPKRKTTHVYLLQSLLQCGWCGSFMSTKYCTSRGKLHPYYQCTKNSHGGKTACDMRYVPATEIENAVLKKLKSMAQDKKLLDKIIKEANDSVDSDIGHLKSEKISQENKLKAVKASIDNIINAISEGIGKTKSISIKLNELEAQREDLERDIDTLGFEIGKIRQQALNAQVIHQSLVKFSQIYDKAEPMDLKELLPNFVQRIIWKPTEIEIALYDQPIQKGQFPSSNHSGKNALEFVDWLPG